MRKYILCLRSSGILFLLMMHLSSGVAQAQFSEELYVYGYFQGQYLQRYQDSNSTTSNVSSFSLQQINLLLSKDFGETFNSFIDIESLNSFSTKEGWGSLRFSEAWVGYHPIQAINIKLGLQVPVFNNLNDIKNRTPLLPYIFRPAVYESSYASLLPIEAFVPDQAYVNIDGTIAVNSTKFDYTVYLGNEKEFTNSDTPAETSVFPSSTDTTRAKLLGGRIGIRRGSLKLGVSGTVDHTNQNTLGLGSVRRNRIGADLSFSLSNFYVEGELISVLHAMTPVQESTLDFIVGQSPFLTNDLDKFFYYFLLGYHANYAWTFYVTFNHMEDHATVFAEKGVDAYMAGFAYRPVDAISFKAQYIYLHLLKSNPGIPGFTVNSFLAGVTVLF